MIEMFVNDTYNVLSYLYGKMDSTYLIKITQSEIANDLNLSRVTINGIFKQLKENKFLIHDDSRIGRYYLTEKAVLTIKLFNDIKDIK